MPTDKRQRKRDGRQARIEAERAAALAAARRRRLITAVVAVLAVFAVLLLLTQTGGDDDEVAGSDTTTTEPPPEVAAAAYGDTPCAPDEEPAEPAEGFASQFEDCLEDGVDYSAEVTTTAGSFTIDLLEERSPSTVNNFVNLARSGFYDGTPFHRVIEGFVAQGGSPDGSGSGGPGYPTLDELPAQGDYELGSVAMANSGPNTQGSQFFVITGDQGIALQPQYSLFGTVTAGMESVMAIELGEPPSEPTVLESVEIIER